MRTTSPPSVEQWQNFLEGALGDVLTDVGCLTPLPTQPLPAGESRVVDEVLKVLVKDSQGRPVAVALCSSPTSPDLVARGMRNSKAANVVLGPDLGRVILQPLLESELSGLSCAVLPYCQPLSTRRVYRRVQRRLLRPELTRWLRQVTQTTVASPSHDEIDHAFMAPLAALAHHAQLPSRLREASQKALDGLEKGQWAPRHVLAHNDFWDGNVLIDSRNVTDRMDLPPRKRFVVIDWPGAAVKGYPMLDLMRLSLSFGLSGRRLREEIEQHCLYLNCEFCQARQHLLTGTGSILMKLEHMPVSMFIRMASRNLDLLESVGG